MLVLVTVNCVGDPTGSGGAVTLQRVVTSGDTLIVGAPGRLLGQPVAFRVLDGYGKPLPAARVHWTITSGNGRLVRTDTISGSDGTLRAQWMLGTRASDVQRLEVGVHLGGNHAPTAEVTAAAVPVEVAALAIQAETTDVRLAVHAQLQALATDPFGNHFVPKDLRFASLDTALAVDTGGVVVPHRRGFARVVATAGGVTDTAVIHGIQVVASIQVDHDTLRFHSLGQDEKLGVTLVDDQGLLVADSLPAIVPSDTSIVALQISNPLVVKSKANGVAKVNLSTSTVSQSAVVVVRQRTASLSLTVASFPFDALNDTVRAHFIALDSLGVPVQTPRITFSSSDTAVVAVDSSGLLRARANGSAMIQAQSLSGVVTTVPVVVAQQVARVVAQRDTIGFDALHAQLPMNAIGIDRLGSPVVGAALTYESDRGGTAAVDGNGQIEALRNGTGSVWAVHGVDSGVVFVVVKQRPVRVVLATDTLRLNALGQSLAISAVAEDSLGSPLVDGVIGVAVADTSVAGAADSTGVQAHANGVTTVTFTVAGLPGQLAVRVAQVPASVSLAGAGFTFDAFNDTARALPQVTDSLGALIVGARVSYWSIDSSIASVDTAGVVRARGNGFTRVVVQAAAGVVGTAPVNVAQQVVRIALARDTLAFNALHAVLPMGAVGLDRLGSPVVVDTLTYTSADSGVATVRADGQIEALANGVARVLAVHGADSAVVIARVQQRPVRVLLGTDTVRLSALGDTHLITAVAVDSLGYSVSGGVSSLAIADPSVAHVFDSATVKAVGNGTTTAAFTVAGVPANVAVLVRQVAASIQVSLDSGTQIVSMPADSLIPVRCRVWDRNGQAISAVPSVGPSSGGRWSGNACDDLRVRHSGFDTLRVVADTVTASLPIVLAVRPIASSAVGDILNADSLPSATSPWAPSARLVQGGVVEVYAALADLSSSIPRSSLHRFKSLDGVNFTYDGLVLDHDADSCALNGTGIENVAIVRRGDAAGWRMYYAAGSNDCYGWQVFSAVSADGRTWVKEPGVRLSNGGPVPPDLPHTPPWPVGEGMVVDQLPSGEWRMIVGSYEHALPTVDKWQIAEWRSSDQLVWSYVGLVLTAGDMPLEAQGSVYSPTIAEIAPGLWRMIFTGDNRGTGQTFRSRLWSAVSVDQVHWQFEGELMGAPGTNLYYSALAGDRLMFIRQDPGQPFRLGVATIEMP